MLFSRETSPAKIGPEAEVPLNGFSTSLIITMTLVPFAIVISRWKTIFVRILIWNMQNKYLHVLFNMRMSHALHNLTYYTYTYTHSTTCTIHAYARTHLRTHSTNRSRTMAATSLQARPVGLKKGELGGGSGGFPCVWFKYLCSTSARSMSTCSADTRAFVWHICISIERERERKKDSIIPRHCFILVEWPLVSVDFQNSVSTFVCTCGVWVCTCVCVGPCVRVRVCRVCASTWPKKNHQWSWQNPCQQS